MGIHIRGDDLGKNGVQQRVKILKACGLLRVKRDGIQNLTQASIIEITLIAWKAPYRLNSGPVRSHFASVRGSGVGEHIASSIKIITFSIYICKPIIHLIASIVVLIPPAYVISLPLSGVS